MQNPGSHAIVIGAGMGGLIAAGAVPIDTLADSRWFGHGVYLANGTSGLRSILLSRPLLETHVRRRLRTITGVCIQENAVVRRLTTAGDRVSGVCLNNGQTIDANLVVDASGRHSRSADWL